MNLHEIIDHVDYVKPNAYGPDELVAWLNELEQAIQVEIMGLSEDLLVHTWDNTWSGSGVTFPDDATMVIPAAVTMNPGGVIDISGLELYTGNDLAGVKILAVTRGTDTTTVKAAPGTFTQGTEPETGTAKIDYDGREEEMLLQDFWSKVYYSYLLAKIDEANTEYSLYANSLQTYNAFMGEYQRWYARNYIDPED